jgi:hypothetical protein
MLQLHLLLLLFSIDEPRNVASAATGGESSSKIKSSLS